MASSAIRIYLLPCRYNHRDLLFDNSVFASYETLERLNVVHGQMVALRW